MTIKTTDTFKVSRKNHPNEKNYPGRPTMETMQAFTQALECLEGEDFDKLCDGTLVYDEERTGELFDSILAGDIIGLCSNIKGVGWVGEQWQVLSIDKEADKMSCQGRYDKDKEREIFFEDVSIGLLLGRAEILLRDGKPYGLTEDELNMTIKIVDLSKKEDGGSAADPVDPASATTDPLETIAKHAESLVADSVPLEETP